MVFWFGKYGNRVILNQYQRVVQTQVPKVSKLKMKEVLLQGDRPIIEYRKSEIYYRRYMNNNLFHITL